MAVTKIYDNSGMVIIRTTCTCLYAGHSVDVCVDKDLPDQRFIMSVYSNDNTSLLERLKTLWRILTGNRVCLAETILSNEDSKTIAEFINENLPDMRPPIP